MNLAHLPGRRMARLPKAVALLAVLFALDAPLLEREYDSDIGLAPWRKDHVS